MTEWLTTSTILEGLGDYSNAGAWERFVRRFHAPIVRFGRGAGLTESDAEDAAQDTLTAFAENYRAGRYDRSKGRLSSWLFGIAFRQVLSKRRSAARRPRAAGETADPVGMEHISVDDALASLWEREWQEALLELCLVRVRQEVEPATMRMFEMVMSDGRTPADAARELGVPNKAVYNAKYTVLKRLRELRKSLEEDF